MTRKGYRTASRHGFTLLEVILSLMLASFVLMVLATAIDLHLRLLDANRTDIEQAQLARAVLRHIATDLRNAIQYNPIDVSSMVNVSTLTSATSSQSGTAASGSGDSGSSSSGGSTSGGSSASGTSGTTSGGTSSGTSNATSSGSTSTTSSSTTTSTGTIAPSSTPGLYGDAKQIQIDTSRVPRALLTTQDNSAAASASSADMASEMKTVTYMLVGAQLASANTANSGGGLVRYELDRASAVYASNNGAYTDSLASQSPLAPEVTDLSFLYYNGTEWVDTWDTTVDGGLPKAVQVSIAVTQPRRDTSSMVSFLSDETATTQDTTRIYRMTVYLPNSEQNTTTGSDTSTSATTTDSSNSSTQSSGTQSTTGQSSTTP